MVHWNIRLNPLRFGVDKRACTVGIEGRTGNNATNERKISFLEQFFQVASVQGNVPCALFADGQRQQHNNSREKSQELRSRKECNVGEIDHRIISPHHRIYDSPRSLHLYNNSILHAVTSEGGVVGFSEEYSQIYRSNKLENY